MNLFDKLNEKQCEAVRTTEGFVRVIAGAGSGKTKLLVSRYAYLVQEYGIDSANILCVTFTNKAAGEMKKRIRALIGPEYDTSLICTYHGFCARLLREDPAEPDLDEGSAGGAGFQHPPQQHEFPLRPVRPDLRRSAL